MKLCGREESLAATVNNGWNQADKATTLEPVQAKLGAMQRNLSRWSASCFGSVNRRIKDLRKKLEQLMGAPQTAENDRKI